MAAGLLDGYKGLIGQQIATNLPPQGNVLPFPLSGPPVRQPAANSDEAERMRLEYMMRLWQSAPALSPFIGRSQG